MIRKLLAIGVALIGFALALTLVLFVLMHTRYATPIVQFVVSQVFTQPVTFEKVEYQYPLHLKFEQVVIEHDAPPVQHIDVWVHPWIIHNSKLAIDSLLIDGITLQNGRPAWLDFSNVYLYQLAIHNLDWAQGEISARGIDIQVKHPYWATQQQWIPYGRIQASADQVYSQGEALDKLLIDASYQAGRSTVYGASFTWRGASVSGQAEQDDSGWSLINVTLENLNLTQELLNTLNKTQWSSVLGSINHINSLDVLHGQINLTDIALNNVDFSVENWQPDNTLWQQSKGYLSLNADSIDWKSQQFIEPNMKLNFTRGAVDIADLNMNWEQADIHLAGTARPHSLDLKQLRIMGLKLYLDSVEKNQWWQQTLSQLQHLSVNHLDIRNSQIIQLSHEPYWQLSGLNIDGKGTDIIRNGQWGLWQGDMTITSNSASLGKTHVSQGIIEMHTQQGQWQIDRVFLPLEQGYVEAKGSWNFQATSKPWRLNLEGNSLPLSTFMPWLSLPLSVDGLADFTMQFDGLAGDYMMLAHSLDGQLQGSLRNGSLIIPVDDNTVIQPFSIDHLTLKADRGRLSLNSVPLNGPALNAVLSGAVDLVTPDQGQINLQFRDIKAGCQAITFELMHNSAGQCQKIPVKEQTESDPGRRVQ